MKYSSLFVIPAKAGIPFIFLFFFLFSSSFAQAAAPIQQVVSSQGVRAWLIEDYTLPLISMSFSFRGGVEMDPQEKQGLSTLTAALLTQGAGPYDAKTFQDRLASSSIQLSFGAGRDEMAGALKTLRSTRGEAFSLLSLALTQPRFDKSDFTRLRDQQSTSVRFRLSNPSWQARYALFSFLFEGHPYSFRSLGSASSLSLISLEDVKIFAKERLAKENLLIAVVGAISKKELVRRLDAVFGDLPEKAGGPDLPLVAWPKETKTICLKREGAQTNIFFGGPMLSRQDPDWYAALIANYILGGGGFESRLMKAVRERGGMSYGISTFLASMDKVSMIAGSVATDTAVAAETLALVKKVWHDFYENGASAEEIAAAKSYLIGSWPLNMTSTDSMASTLLSLQQEELGPDYRDKRESFLKNVTRVDIKRVIKKYFNPAMLSFATVGGTKKLSCDLLQDEAKE